MREIRHLISLLLAVTLSLSCAAQYTPPQSKISSETEVVEGVRYHLHTVERRETLYSLSKLYQLPIQEIIERNPQLKEGLKIGQVLYLKSVDQSNIPDQTTTQAAAQPTIQVTTPPTTEATAPPTNQISTPQLIATHQVKWYETLTSIAKKYGVSEEEIIAVNNLSGRRVATRQKLKIPYPGTVQLVAEKSEGEREESEQEELESITTEREESEEKRVRPPFSLKELFGAPTYFKEIEAKLLLPLTTTTEEGVEEPRSSYMEFYQGFLLALHHLKEEHPSLKVQLEVIDTEQEKVEQLIEKNHLKDADILFGPIERESLELLLNSESTNHSIVISPLDPGSDYLAKAHPNFYQITTPSRFQQREILSMINPLFDLLLIWEEGGRDWKLVEESKALLDSAHIEYKELSYGILEGRTITREISEQLIENSINHVLILSESEAFIADAMRNLHLIKNQDKKEIKLYGQPRWRNYRILDVNLFHEMNLTIPTQYWVDYNNQKVNHFLGSYRALYNREPTPYAFQAYDIATYFLSNMWEKGEQHFRRGTKERSSLLQSDFRFIREENGGFINRAVRKIEYNPDYTITYW